MVLSWRSVIITTLLQDKKHEWAFLNVTVSNFSYDLNARIMI